MQIRYNSSVLLPPYPAKGGRLCCGEILITGCFLVLFRPQRFRIMNIIAPILLTCIAYNWAQHFWSVKQNLMSFWCIIIIVVYLQPCIVTVYTPSIEPLFIPNDLLYLCIIHVCMYVCFHCQQSRSILQVIACCKVQATVYNALPV